MERPEQTETELQGENSGEPLETLIRRLAEFLPLQGPITGFAFLNTLQALETVPFHEGLIQGARLYDAHPYYSEEKYHEYVEQGRIRYVDLTTVLEEFSGEASRTAIGPSGTLGDLQLAMLMYPPRQATDSELRWLVAESDALRKFRTDIPEAFRIQCVHETKRLFLRESRPTSRPDETMSVDGVPVFREMMKGLAKVSESKRTPAAWQALTLEYLWRVCRQGIQQVGNAFESGHHLRRRYREVLLDVTGQDSDLLVHEVLIKFTAPFVDQGQADWPLPHKSAGFMKCFFRLFSADCCRTPDWARLVGRELQQLAKSPVTAEQLLIDSLNRLGVSPAERESYLLSSLLALRGWAGLLWQMESRPDRVPFPVPPGTLLEFLAVRLLLDRLATEFLVRQEFSWPEPIADLRPQIEALDSATSRHPSEIQKTFLLFQIAQCCGWTPESLDRLSHRQWKELLSAIESFHSLKRRELLHRAFERRYRQSVLDAFQLRLQRSPVTVEQPTFQAIFCIDAREESFRRHLEEIAPQVETFGTAGFFGVPMYFKGAGEAHFSPLCPVVIKPQHWVTEEVVESFTETHARRARTRRTLGKVSHQALVGSRGMAGGALLTAGFGVLATAPLVARVLFPRLTARLFHRANQYVSTPRITRLRLERLQDPPGPEEAHQGFSLAEMAGMAERALQDIGLIRNFAPLVMIFGHGSSCLNNPHASAYDCGACSGRAGAPNARALASMLNDGRVRDILRANGISIPAETRFVGGLHNTGADSISILDADQIPQTHFDILEQALSCLEAACQRNAHERCRRFDLAPLGITPEQALEHVEERCEDLAQTRPEYGNSTNAVCYVGRRSRIRGLFLDRRAFLMSYDPTTDDEEATILGRILGAVVPVCSGINMQYTLSALDNIRWGCGSKLPHNITSLLGVMEGASSDLRPGLPWQGVDIHEPMRLLFLLETTPEKLQKIMDRNETVARILKNQWGQLALIDPESSQIRYLNGQQYQEHVAETTMLPKVTRSEDWYLGSREHLPFALIESASAFRGKGRTDV